MHKLRLATVGLVVAFIAYGFTAVPAHAVLLHDNGAWSSAFGGFPSVDGTGELDVADDFTATDNWSVDGATWVGVFVDGTVTSLSRVFVIEIFNDASGEPSAVPIFVDTVTASATLLTDTPVGFEAAEVYSFAANFNTAASLASGQTYYFSVTDAGPGASASNGMFWAIAGASDPLWVRVGDTGGWNLISGDRAFSLSGDLTASVPEPATLAIFGLGLLGMGLVRRRRAA